ncbi:hypothetical protein [Aeoliella sp. SH292]|uniref:hypothetical protein n=1 Tax=Aeoliella sp. SH292 TaxID=3454464 RepID=UPI003F9862F6
MTIFESLENKSVRNSDGAAVFNFLRRTSDPTKEWPPYDGRMLNVDVVLGTLNSISLGSPIQLFSFLGPVHDQPWRNGIEFRYFSLGLCLEVSKSSQTVEGLHLVRYDRIEKQYTTFSGRTYANYQDLDLLGLTPLNCQRELGGASEVEPDGEGALFTFKLGGRKCEIEFDSDGTFLRLILTHF